MAHNAGASWLAPIVSVSVPGAHAVSLESSLDLAGVAISRTAACRQGLDTESAVVRAAFPEALWRARSALRWSIGWYTTDADISTALARSVEPLSPKRPDGVPTSPLATPSPLAAIPTVVAKTDLK